MITDDVPEWVRVVHEWPLSVAVRESEWLFPILQTFHIFGLVLLVGVIAILDLRLLGLALRSQPPGPLARWLLPLSRWGFAVVFASGVLLLAAQSGSLYQNVFLRIKLLLLAAALLNVVLFHAGVFRRFDEWAGAVAVPRAAAAFAGASLTFWLGVLVTGRYIAYF